MAMAIKLLAQNHELDQGKIGDEGSVRRAEVRACFKEASFCFDFMALILGLLELNVEFALIFASDLCMK
ncbi:hypothetical protein MTR_4g065097 [Medicago truncatula]|uniref:Uncharacterized protein n=1 Tax=Medicago truncatula TaxID=3880 RepID=A0A072UMC2_MEDTR|nr:hypothetical protein MTR_4g065097 [Medicago truncatula]